MLLIQELDNKSSLSIDKKPHLKYHSPMFKAQLVSVGAK